MKRYFLLLFVLGMAFSPRLTQAAIVVPNPTEIAAPITPELFINLARSDVEELLGRRLKFTERIAFAKAKRRVARDLASGQQDPAPSGNGMAVAGFVCGIVGLFVFGIILGPIAIVFSAIGLSKSKKEGRPLRGLAIAGLVLGVVAVIGWAIVVASL